MVFIQPMYKVYEWIHIMSGAYIVYNMQKLRTYIHGGIIMATTINGAVSNQSQSAMTGMLTIKNTNDAQARMSAVRANTRKKGSTTKKPLNYNHREISGQLLRAKKSQSASNVLTRAKSRLAMLQRQAGSGQYDEKEIANALAHARRMVRCAQLKVRNLRQEEQERNAHRKEKGEHEQQKQNEVKRRVAQREREIEKKIAIEEMQAVVTEKRKRGELVRKRRIHRNQEQSRINEADMKYLKAQMESGGGASSYSSQAQGAVLDLSMEAAAMAEVQMLEAQIQQQVELEIEAEIAAEVAVEMAMAGMGDPGASMSSASSDSAESGVVGAEVGVSVDISV